MCRLMLIYWKDFAEASLSFTELHKKNDKQNKNSQGKQTHSWKDLLAIIESHRWGFPGVTKHMFYFFMNNLSIIRKS